jgi:hypothetical protein
MGGPGGIALGRLRAHAVETAQPAPARSRRNWGANRS